MPFWVNWQCSRGSCGTCSFSAQRRIPSSIIVALKYTHIYVYQIYKCKLLLLVTVDRQFWANSCVDEYCLFFSNTVLSLLSGVATRRPATSCSATQALRTVSSSHRCIRMSGMLMHEHFSHTDDRCCRGTWLPLMIHYTVSDVSLNSHWTLVEFSSNCITPPGGCSKHGG